MADKRAPEIAECLRNSGFIVYPSPADGHSSEAHEKTGGGIKSGKYENGAADLLVAKNGLSVLIEVKNAGNSFPFSLWRDDQREWAQKAEQEYGTPYWLAIVMGTGRPDTKDIRKFPRKAWIMPVHAYIALENVMRRCEQKSIPYLLGKTSKIILRAEYNPTDKDLDAVHQLGGELLWQNGGWMLHENHILRRHFEQRKEDNAAY